MSLILAINAGINSSAGVFRNGVAEICIEEERLNRIKNWFGFPEQAIRFLVDNGYVNMQDLTDIVVCDETVAETSREKFYSRYAYHYRYGTMLAYNTGFAKSKQELKTQLKKLIGKDSEPVPTDGNRYIADKIAYFGFDTSKIRYIEHHRCHASSAYYGLANSLDEKCLIFTLDGGGDNLRSTVSIGYNGVIERKTAGNEYSVGNIYSAVTHHLGFRSHEHEYKLMGLAPYVNPDYATGYRDFFDRFLYLVNDDTEFANPYFINHSIFFSEVIKELSGSRFDNIAAGLQSFTEAIVKRWVLGNIKKYGINKILCSGGVFMNVKLNKLLSQLPEVEYIDVFPSCGDESNIFGAAYECYNRSAKSVGLLKKYTLGPSPTGDLETALKEYSDQVVVERVENINRTVAELLAANAIVARCTGNMEFGARALGNRSVLANPSAMQNINKINRSVKKRDFWMPFAPAITSEQADDFIDIPSSLRRQGSPYMMFAFDSKPANSERIVCGIHQADFTARAQIVDQDFYPELHEIIREFYTLTGVPCVLNTSFNLHGYPIVTDSRQAIDVLLQSGIDVLVIDNYLIKRK